MAKRRRKKAAPRQKVAPPQKPAAPPPATFAEALRTAREATKLDRTTVGAAAGIGKAYYYKVELGRMPPPTDARILLLADRVGADPAVWLQLARNERGLSRPPRGPIPPISDALRARFPDVAVKTLEEGRSHFANLLREARTAVKMSQDEVAAAAGMSEGYYRQIESRGTRPPSDERILLLASVLRTAPERLIKAAQESRGNRRSRRMPGVVPDAVRDRFLSNGANGTGKRRHTVTSDPLSARAGLEAQRAHLVSLRDALDESIGHIQRGIDALSLVGS